MSPLIPFCFPDDTKAAFVPGPSAINSHAKETLCAAQSRYVRSLVAGAQYGTAAQQIRQIIDTCAGPAPEWTQALNLLEELRRYQQGREQ